MRISDWSSDVCSSDLGRAVVGGPVGVLGRGVHGDPDAYAKAANCLVPQAAGNAFSTRGRIGNREWFARGRSQHDRHSIACGTAGLIVGAITLTGLGLRMTAFVELISMGSVLAMLFFTAAVCLVLGLGMPTTANYILMATLKIGRSH